MSRSGKRCCYNKVRYTHSVLHEVCQGVVKGVVIIK